MVVAIQRGTATGEKLYLVRYEDDDREHMTEQQVRDFAFATAASSRVSVEPLEGIRNTDSLGPVQSFSAEEVEDWRLTVESIPGDTEE